MAPCKRSVEDFHLNDKILELSPQIKKSENIVIVVHNLLFDSSVRVKQAFIGRWKTCFSTRSSHPAC